MTTNMTPIEALEKILIILPDDTYFNRKNYSVKQEMLREIKEIAKQALAPQEPQQKTFTVEEVKNIMYSVENKYFGERMVTIFIEYVIKEFEKEVK